MPGVLQRAIPGAPIRTRRLRARKEDGIQKAIVQYVRLALPPGRYLCFSVPNEGKRSEASGKRLREMGMLAGVSDLEILGPEGRSFFLEVKTDEGRPSNPQKDFAAFCAVNHVPHAIVRGIDDTKRALVGWGLVRGAA